jgi:hypothetical protein
MPKVNESAVTEQGLFGNKTVTFCCRMIAGRTRAIASSAALLFHEIARQLLFVVGH